MHQDYCDPCISVSIDAKHQKRPIGEIWFGYVWTIASAHVYDLSLQKLEGMRNEYRWLEVATLYRNLLRSVPESQLVNRRVILEQAGFCGFKAAMQSSDTTVCRSRIREAMKDYKEASDIAAREKHGRGYFFRFKGMLSLLQYWMSKTPVEKKHWLDDAWVQAKRAMKSFQAQDDNLEYARTFNYLSAAAALSSYYERDFESKARKPIEAVERGRQVIKTLSATRENKEVLTMVLAKTALFLDDFSECIASPAEQKDCDRRALGYWNSAVRKSRSVALAALGSPPRGFGRIFSHEEGLALCEEALKLTEQTGDNFSIGWLLSSMANRLFWKAELRTVDKRQSSMIAKESLEAAEKSVEHYERIGFTSPSGGVMWVHSPYAEHFLELSWFGENPQKARLLGEKALSSTPQLLQTAGKSGYPEVYHYAYHVASKCNMEFAETEPSIIKKTALLKTALKLRKRSLEVTERVESPGHWNVGVGFRYLSDILANLSRLENDSETSHRLLTEAVRQKRRGVELSNRFVQSMEKSGNHMLRAPLAKYYAEYADLLSLLHKASGKIENLRKSAQAYVAAAGWYENTPAYNGQASCYWKAARSYETLRAYSVAAENFDKASKSCLAASKTKPPQREFWRELSAYMNAWREIELAHQCHTQLQYDLAGRHYRVAARLHRSKTEWSSLVPYYLGWAHVESAENHSINGRFNSAIESFNEAVHLFAESKRLFQNQLSYLDLSEERAMVSELVNASREQYCQARVLLEEARKAEAEGDPVTSSEKFALAAEKLNQISTLPTNPALERNETRFLQKLARAWAVSTRAEAQGSRGMLERALVLFKEARSCSPDKTAQKLSSGHMEFCQGLLASPTFNEKVDSASYDAAARHFESAANHYLDSGFTLASHNSTAEKLVLNASTQIDRGSTLQDPKEKAEAYTSAESLLRESVIEFEKSHQFERAKQVSRLLERTQAEWERTVQLKEALQARRHGSANIVFHTPLRGEEEAVGLDRLERADVRITVTESAGRSKLPALIEVRIQIINPTRKQVKISRVDNAIPETAELAEVSQTLRRQGQSLLVEPEFRVDPQKRESILFSIQPKHHGLMVIAPRVVFATEDGGDHPQLTPPKTVATSPIMTFLAAAYNKDYTHKRLSREHCGWRTLMETIRATRIPKSHLYGEPEYGRPFGRQLEELIEASVVESRVFRGERGRGGEITKIRVLFENETVKSYLDETIRSLWPNASSA